MLAFVRTTAMIGWVGKSIRISVENKKQLQFVVLHSPQLDDEIAHTQVSVDGALVDLDGKEATQILERTCASTSIGHDRVGHLVAEKNVLVDLDDKESVCVL